jgi:hypothetical protein
MVPAVSAWRRQRFAGLSNAKAAITARSISENDRSFFISGWPKTKALRMTPAIVTTQGSAKWTIEIVPRKTASSI